MALWDLGKMEVVSCYVWAPRLGITPQLKWIHQNVLCFMTRPLHLDTDSGGMWGTGSAVQTVCPACMHESSGIKGRQNAGYITL